MFWWKYGLYDIVDDIYKLRLHCLIPSEIRGVIEKFVSFSDILSNFCDVHIEIKYISSNWMLFEKQL